MTRVWMNWPSNDAEFVDATKFEQAMYSRFLNLADGRRLADIWELPTISTCDEDARGRPRKQKPLHLRADVPSGYLTLLLLRRRAREVVEEALSPYGEFLPAISLDEGEEYSFFNPTCIVDALDLSRSEVERFPSGRIYSVVKFVLNEDPGLHLPMFRLKDDPGRNMLFSDSFREFWLAKGLTGLDFRKIWDSEESS